MRLIGKLLTQSMVLRKHSRRGRRGASMAFIESERDLFQYPLRSALQNCQRWLAENKPLSINREKRDGYNSRGYYFSRRPATRNANDAIRSDTRCRRLRRTTFRFGYQPRRLAFGSSSDEASEDGCNAVRVKPAFNASNFHPRTFGRHMTPNRPIREADIDRRDRLDFICCD